MEQDSFQKLLVIQPIKKLPAFHLGIFSGGTHQNSVPANFF
jgi:hypothetical protein